MRIFITGVNGFIGQALAKRLNKEHLVFGLIMPNEKPKISNITIKKSDLLNFNLIDQIIQKIKPEVIIHLAARTEVEKSFYEPVSFSTINYSGTVNLIEQARKDKDLKLFIFASTMETYGWQSLDNWKPFDENTPQNPNAPYAVAKVGCEYYLKYAGRAYKFPYTILRQTNTYGRKDNDFFVVEQIITQMLKNKKEINLGYNEPYRNFLYIDDLIDVYETIINNIDKARGEIFCLGPDNALSIEDLVIKIAKKLNWHGKMNWNTKPARIGEVYYLNSTNKKIKKVLGWQPKIDLDKGLEQTIKCWKKILCPK